ncbi:hypothetical protein Emag_005150 [Eimeria magna]
MDVLPVRESHAGDPVSTMHAGSERRRLAGDHNPYEERPPEPPPSTDYSDLCAELGEWIPMDPLPGNRRASPLIFEGILRDLEESDFSGSPPSTSASSVIREDTSSQAPYSSPDLKRLASGVFQVEDEEDEEPVDSPATRSASSLFRRIFRFILVASQWDTCSEIFAASAPCSSSSGSNSTTHCCISTTHVTFGIIHAGNKPL